MATKKLYEKPPKDLERFVEKRTKYIELPPLKPKATPKPKSK